MIWATGEAPCKYSLMSIQVPTRRDTRVLCISSRRGHYFPTPQQEEERFSSAWQQLNQWELILIRLSRWAVCETLVGWPGMEPSSQQWECRLLTTRLCGIPLNVSINRIQLDSHICFCIQSIGLSLSRILWKPTLYTWCHENSSALGHPLIGSWGLSRGYQEYLRNVA